MTSGSRERVIAVRTQVGRVLAAVVVVGAMISGCAGAGQAGAAVIVGDVVVPIETVQSKIAARLSQPGQKPAADEVARVVVSDEVMHGALRRHAAKAGITVPDAAIDQFITSQGGVEAVLQETGLADVAELRSSVVDFLTEVQIGQQVTPGLSVTTDTLEATDRADAEKKARVLAAGGRAAEALFADARSAPHRNVVAPAISAAGDQSSVVFGTPAGRVGYYQVSEQGPWRVFKITDRRTNATADPAAVSRLSLNQAYLIGMRTVEHEAEQAGIQVNPRFGEWDPVRMVVVGSGTALGAVLPATSS